MCCPLGTAISGLEKTVGCFSTYIHFRFKTTTDLDLKVVDLKNQMRNLMELRKEVENEKTQAETNGNKIRPIVETWLKKVEEFFIVKPEEKPSAKDKWLKEVEEYVIVKPEEKVDKKQPQACFLNSFDLYKAIGEVKGKIKTIEDLIKEAHEFRNHVIDTKRLIPVEHINGATIQGQKTAQDTLNEVWKLLDDDGIWSIGIWGLSGIGKTTLVRTLNNELKIKLEDTSTQLNPFTFVIWAEVSNKSDKDDNQRLRCLKGLQTKIADRLKMGKDLHADGSTMGEDLETMASRLHHRLKNEKVLLILDNVWKKIDLEKLGIPRLEENKGCKVILTTQFKQVCRDMGTNREVKMNVLNHKEAKELFNQKAKYEDRSKKIIPLAKKIVEECCRLPRAISFVGTALSKTTEVEQWRHALNELQRSVPSLAHIKDEVYVPLKDSYESLEGNTIKSCFLYCSLFPEGFSIERTKLVEHWMAEGLINEKKNYTESMDEGIYIIEVLKDSCLLEDGDNKDIVKMHDVVRDVAIWIASSSEDKSHSLVRSGIGLTEISGGELSNSNSLKRVSFMNNKITKLPDSVKCHNASTLLLQHNGSLDTVPEGFLQGFKAVRVLNLSSTNISSLPSSLLELRDLRALILRECKFLKDLPMLDGLYCLQMLDLHACGIRELPTGMEKLNNLRQLDLSNTGKLKTIKARIISSLTSLQVLDMRGSAFDFCVKGKEEKGQTTFEELKVVGQLCNLYIKLQGIPEDLSWIDRLKKFQIFIGPKAPFPTTSHDKMVVIDGPDLTQKLIKQLRSIGSLESLTISHSKCQIEKCPSDPLPNTNSELGLEELRLLRVSDLESIGHLGLNFHYLKSIEVRNCSDMKYVFSCGDFIRTLPSLEVIQVSSCDNLKELFNYGSGQNMASIPVVPELRKLKLWGLSKLSTLSRHKETWPRLEEVEVFFCHRLIRLPLTNQNAETIKEIRGESKWWNALKWDDDETKSSLQRYFCDQHLTTDTLRYLLHEVQHFLSQSQLLTHNKRASRMGLGDDDFVGGKKINGCFPRA